VIHLIRTQTEISRIDTLHFAVPIKEKMEIFFLCRSLNEKRSESKNQSEEIEIKCVEVVSNKNEPS
jgi:hypothetical protein